MRKDLSFFGSFGKRGVGYNVPLLAGRLREILGLVRHYRVILLGAGRIGSALAAYPGFRARGFDVVAVYDAHPARIEVLALEQLVALARALGPRLAS